MRPASRIETEPREGVDFARCETVLPVSSSIRGDRADHPDSVPGLCWVSRRVAPTIGCRRPRHNALDRHNRQIRRFHQDPQGLPIILSATRMISDNTVSLRAAPRGKILVTWPRFMQLFRRLCRSYKEEERPVGRERTASRAKSRMRPHTANISALFFAIRTRAGQPEPWAESRFGDSFRSLVPGSLDVGPGAENRGKEETEVF